MDHRFSPHIALGDGPCLPNGLPIAPMEATIPRMRLPHGRHGERLRRRPVGGPDGPDILLTGTSAAPGVILPSDAPFRA